MTPSKDTEVDVAPTTVIARRLVIYVVAVMALGVVVWALIDGGERDLWTQVPTVGAWWIRHL